MSHLPRTRWLMYILLLPVCVFGPLQEANSTAIAETLTCFDSLALPPLPGHGGVAGLPPGEDYFVSGYVFENSQPVSGANISLVVADQTVETTTVTPNGFDCPFFYVSLAQLSNITVGQQLLVHALYNGKERTELALVQAAGQRVDIDLDSQHLSGIVQIASAGDTESSSSPIEHTCALLITNRVVCWGSNSRGQLGNGKLGNEYDSELPVVVVNLEGNISHIATGGTTSCAIVDGGVKCWGNNYTSQFGNGTRNSSAVPIQTIGLESGVKMVVLGNTHTCALTIAGAVYCWGGGGAGQLGNGSGALQTMPMIVPGLESGVVGITAGYAHTCAWLENGEARCWGANGKGQLGDKSFANRFTPVSVLTSMNDNSPLHGVTAMVAGGYMSCAVIEFTTVKCWGQNNRHQLGTNTPNPDSYAPVSVQNLSGRIIALTTGHAHVCAITEGNGIICWGDNSSGQTGNGFPAFKTLPANAINLSMGGVSISAGANHTCAVLGDGQSKCWGLNNRGQLGDGTRTSRARPAYLKEGVMPQLPAPSGMPLPAAEWAMLVVAIADNNLASHLDYQPGGMVDRLISSGANADVHVAVLFDGDNYNDTSRYILAGDGSATREALGELAMDSEETLYDFVKWGFTNLPAQHYYLAIVDHANGVVGIGLDKTSDPLGKAFLEPHELSSAIQQASVETGKRFDIIHFDGCSFGLFEDTSIIASFTDYVIASPNTGWGIFAFDAYRQLIVPDMTPHLFATSIADHYADRLTGMLPYTIAVYDMAYYDVLKQQIDQLGIALTDFVTLADQGAHIEHLRQLRDLTVQKYDSDNLTLEPQDNYIDLRHWVSLLQSSDNSDIAARASQLVGATTVGTGFIAYERHQSGEIQLLDTNEWVPISLDNASGLGIYFPHSAATAGGGDCMGSSEQGSYCQYIGGTLFTNLPVQWGWRRFIQQMIENAPISAASNATLQPERLLAPLPVGPQSQVRPPSARATAPIQQIYLPIIQQ